jgi:hypothetical protein
VNILLSSRSVPKQNDQNPLIGVMDAGLTNNLGQSVYLFRVVNLGQEHHLVYPHVGKSMDEVSDLLRLG